MTKTQMGPKTPPMELMQALRNLERKGLIESRLCPDGEVRWYTTEKGRYVRPDEVHISEKLLD